MKGGMAFVTFNPEGVIQIKINRFSPREMLLFHVKGGQGPPCSRQCISSQSEFLPLLVPWGHIHCQPLHTKMLKNRNISTNQYKHWGHYAQPDDNINYLEKKNSKIHCETGKKRSCCLKIKLGYTP